MKARQILSNYLNDNKFKITIYENNKVDIENYDNIIDFNLNKVVLEVDRKNIIIEGMNLTINKMLDNEVLIEGIISGIRIN